MHLLDLLAVAVLSQPNVQAIHHAFHDDAEHEFVPQCSVLATGDFDKRSYAVSKWPVDVLSIGHTIASYQNYGGDPYFHHGLDIRANAGSPVYASRGGKVVNIENYVMGQPEYWEVAILDDDGFLWQYHHVDRDDIPQEIFKAFQQGTKIADGTKIGTVVYWPVSTFGEQYHHVHLNILGKNKEYLNPFAFLEPLNDDQAPRIEEIALLKDGKKVTGTSVSGNYSVMLNASDLIRHQKFIVPPDRIQVRIDGSDLIDVWHFTKLPGGSSNEDYVNKFFVQGLVCGNYTCRKPIMNLGFTKNEAQIFPTTAGEHSVTVVVSDFEGNSDDRTFSWTVR